MGLKILLVKGSQYLSILTFLGIACVYPYGLKEYLIVRLELYFSEKVILLSGDTAATYKLSDLSLEYDTIFDEPYVERQ